MNAQKDKFNTAKFGHNNFLQNKNSIKNQKKNSNEETLRKKM